MLDMKMNSVAGSASVMLGSLKGERIVNER